MARTALRAGRPVVIANSRGPESLASVASALGDGASAGTVAEAAASGIVVIAVPWAGVPMALEGLRWNGQIVIDDLEGTTSSEVVADLVGDAPVVKAANTLAAAILAADPRQVGGQRVLFLSGDDPEAKAEVSALFQDAGFFTIDLGDLSTGGGMQQVGGPLAGANLIRLPDLD
jgi:hypothetical protein